MMPETSQATYQVLYIGPEGLPKFVDLMAQSDEEAEEMAGDYAIRHRDNLRSWGNYRVTLYKRIRDFGVAAPSTD